MHGIHKYGAVVTRRRKPEYVYAQVGTIYRRANCLDLNILTQIQPCHDESVADS